MKVKLIVTTILFWLSGGIDAAQWFDEEKNDSTSTSAAPPVNSNPYLEAYQRGLNGLNPDGTPIIIRIPQSQGYRPSYNPVTQYPRPSYRSENNKITFFNQSGEPALVKVRGTTNTQTFVPNGSSSTVTASGGTHYILVRYGSSPPYSYSKGESFSVDETATQYSAITITLHKVAHGNYSSSSTSQAEFDSQ